MRLLMLQDRNIFLGKLRNFVNAMWVLRSQSSLLHNIDMVYQIILAAEILDVGQESVFGNVGQWIFENGIELVRVRVVDIEHAFPVLLVVDILRPFGAGIASIVALLRLGVRHYDGFPQNMRAPGPMES